MAHGRNGCLRNDDFPISRTFLTWAESLSGFMTTIESKYGGVEQMLDAPGWDQGKTQYARELVCNLHRHLGKLKREMEQHGTEQLR